MNVTLWVKTYILFRSIPPVLEHIKANVSKQCDQNEASAKKLRGLLKDYEAKLKDLEQALKEAENTVKKANTKNGLNAQELEDLLVMTHKTHFFNTKEYTLV